MWLQPNLVPERGLPTAATQRKPPFSPATATARDGQEHSFLGVERAGAKAARMERRVAPVLEDAPDWLSAVFRQALAKWRKADRAMGCGPDDAEAIEQLFRVAVAVHRGAHEGLDLRRFSTRVLGDSKAIERLRGRLASLPRHNPALADLEDDELFHALGLEKFPPPLFLKGAVRMRYGGARMDLSELRPYVALSPDAVDDMGLASMPPYVLSIENLASFQRHVREIDDQGLVLDTGGFPGPAFRVIMARLDQLVDEAVPFFHWGDMDLGGIRIFKHLAGFVQRPLAPHLMEPPAGLPASRPPGLPASRPPGLAAVHTRRTPAPRSVRRRRGHCRGVGGEMAGGGGGLPGAGGAGSHDAQGRNG